jgi:hypothetical protein
MLKVIEVVFDGKAFVPTAPVDLPAGTTATVALPGAVPPGSCVGPPPPPMTDEQRADWERLCKEWDATPLPWATVHEAVDAMRSPTWLPEGAP